MRRSLWFKTMTILGLACGSLCALQSSLWSADAPAAATSEAKAEDKAHGEAHPASAHPDPRHDAAHPADPHAAEGHAPGAQPGPMEWKTDLALWTLITFGVFLVVLKALAWKPLMSGLDARERGILANIENANKARVDAEAALSDYRSRLSKAEEEVRQILADARKAAETARTDMLATTQKEVSNMKDRALAEIDQVRIQALEELFSHMAGTVTKATEQVLRRSLTPADQDRLVSEAVAQFAKR